MANHEHLHPDSLDQRLVVTQATGNHNNPLTTDNNLYAPAPEISRLGLPPQAANTLLRGNIVTEEQLARTTTKELQKIPGINETSLADIQEVFMF